MSDNQDDENIEFINEIYATVFEDIKLFEEMLSMLPSEYRQELRLVFGKIIGGISRCHRELAEVARQKIEGMQSDLNYLIFDIEATRRERDDYKRRLGS